MVRFPCAVTLQKKELYADQMICSKALKRKITKIINFILNRVYMELFILFDVIMVYTMNRAEILSGNSIWNSQSYAYYYRVETFGGQNNGRA